MKKWIVMIICVLIIGFVGYQLYSSKTSAQQVTTQVRTATVQKGKLEVKVSGSGTVQRVTSEDIKSTIDNNAIDEVLVSAGESVTNGEKLVTFTDSDPITAPADGEITTVSATAGQRVTALSFLFSLVVGIVFGVFPANKASKLNPIQALRYE